MARSGKAPRNRTITPTVLPEHQPSLWPRPRRAAPARTRFRIADAKGEAGGDQNRGHLRLQRQRAVDAGVQVEPGRQVRAQEEKTPTMAVRIEDF